MDKRARSFLEVLQDGRWHRKIWKTAKPLFGVWIVEACVHLGLADRKISRKIGSFKITTKGRKALKTNYRPDKEELSDAIRCSRGTSLFCYCDAPAGN